MITRRDSWNHDDAGYLQALHNLPGHCSNIGAAVTLDFSNVTKTSDLQGNNTCHQNDGIRVRKQAVEELQCNGADVMMRRLSIACSITDMREQHAHIW